MRRLITVESGLNDGIATPVVMLAIAGAASAESAEGTGMGGAAVDLLIGALVGAAIGVGGGWLLRRARRAHWASEEFAGMWRATPAKPSPAAFCGDGWSSSATASPYAASRPADAAGRLTRTGVAGMSGQRLRLLTSIPPGVYEPT